MIRYAITDPKYYSLRYLQNLHNRADFVLFRDKKSKEYSKLAKEFIDSTKEFSYKKIIHGNYMLAKELNSNGVHLTSTQFNDIKKAKELELFTIISTHSLKEIKRAKELGADAITFSPIFDTPNKGKAKGIKALEEAIRCCQIKIIALGGIITNEHIKKIESTKVWGFASIRYFLNSN